MLSRVAESLFWLGRYTERAENYARFIDVNINLSIDLPPGLKEQWEPLVTTTGDRDLFLKSYDSFSKENVIRFLAFDSKNPSGIISCVKLARENARIIRESISKETWETLNDLYYFMDKLEKKKVWKKDDSLDCFKQIKNYFQLLNGIADDTVPRTEGWYFSKMGQFLERADKTSRMLDVKYHFLLPSTQEVGSPLDFLHWTALLKSVSAYNSYRRFYGAIKATSIVDYLVLNRYFPRSIFFCLINVENCLHEISESSRGFSNPAEKAIGNLRAEVEFSDINDIFSYGLHEYLDKIQEKFNEVSIAINDQYFKVKPNSMTSFQSQD